MPKARPEHIRFTLSDDVQRGVPLDIPSPRYRTVGLIVGLFFAVFLAVAAAVIGGLSPQPSRDVFGLMMFLFEVFWIVGWSGGVLVLGVLTVVLIFYHESTYISGTRLVHVPRLGLLKIACEYDLAKIRNVRAVPTSDAKAVRISFDYGEGTVSLGNAMPSERAEVVIRQLDRSQSRAGSGAVSRDGPEAPVAALPAPSREPAGRPGPSSAPGFALIAANLVPLAGVLLLGWDLGEVMVLYWAESAVIGFYTLLKVATVAKLVGIVAVPFFLGHFGGFMVAHFAFLHGFFIEGSANDPATGSAISDLRTLFVPLWPALAALLVSHGVSFALNFIGRREYASATIPMLMALPYRRIVAMHLTLIIGGFLMMVLGMPTLTVALLVIFKTAADLHTHRSEHSAMTHHSERGRAAAGAVG